MNLDKKIKVVLVLIVLIVLGYVVFNQLFYEPPTTPVVVAPNEPDDTPEIPIDPDEEDIFEGLYVEKVPYVDVSNEVLLVHQVEQVLTNPLSIYKWEEATMPVYQKEKYNIVQLNELALQLYKTIDIEKDELTCSTLNQDGWEIVVCEFEQGYIEVIQDGSFYIILHTKEETIIDSYEIDDIEDIIENSWIKNIIVWDEYEVVLERLHYDTYDQEIVDISIVEKTDEAYKEKLTLDFSFEHSSIVGLSKTADRGEKIMDVDITSMDDIQKHLKNGEFESIIVDKTKLDEIELLGYELLYDATSYKNAIVPTIHVLTTSFLKSYVDYFEAQGIVVHPLKVMGTSEQFIRVR